MRNTANLKAMKPLGAEGRVRIDYTDPVTGKIKEQIKGTNHVFTDSLSGRDGGISSISSSPIFLSNNTAAVDVNLPYMTGTMIGYGVPDTGSLGTYRGAWNSSSGYLGFMTSTGMASKFVYDFTPLQVTEEVKQVGLTLQFGSGGYSIKPYKFTGGLRTGDNDVTSLLFGKTLFKIVTGVVSKTDLLSGITTTYDLTATLSATSYNSIGVNPNDGTCYIRVSGSTPANRKVYKYSDDSFSTLLATYSISTWANNTSDAFGVWGNYLYDLPMKDSIDFVNDSSYSLFDVTADPAILAYTNATAVSSYLVSIADKYMFLTGGGTTAYSVGPMLSLEQGAVVGYIAGKYRGTGGVLKCPINLNDKAFYAVDSLNTGLTVIANAIAIYRLPVDAPTRPAGSGMTVTYELDVHY